MFRLLLLAAAAFPAVAAAQQAAPAPEPAAADDRVVVQGQRADERPLAEVTREFVREIADPPSHSVGIARWADDVCVGVENLAMDPAQYIADRVSEVALEVGLDPGQPGCAPNIAIVFAPDGDALASLMIEEQPGALRPFGGEGSTNHGSHALAAFSSSGAPVRWWQVTIPVDRRGYAAIETNEIDGPPYVPGGNSHITVLHRDVLLKSIVIVDGPKIQGVNWRQLADYIAIVTLAQIDPESDVSGFDSILNLFNENASAPPGLTEWDLAYLRAVYAFDQYRIPRSQSGVLAHELARQVRASENGATQ